MARTSPSRRAGFSPAPTERRGHLHMSVVRTRGSGARQRATDATMRVSDAERAEVADQLAQHYADGRIDQAELTGITDDLPEAGGRPAARTSASPARSRTNPPAPRARWQWPRALLIV